MGCNMTKKNQVKFIVTFEGITNRTSKEKIREDVLPTMKLLKWTHNKNQLRCDFEEMKENDRQRKND